MYQQPLYSERLKHRLVSSSDLNVVHNLHCYAEVDAFNTLGLPESVEETQSILHEWIVANNQIDVRQYTFAIEHINSSQFIGIFGFKLWPKKHLRGEVWYKIHPNQWCNGYATESLRLMINFGFKNLGLHRIQAGCAVENIASIKVLEKAGMLREGRGRQVLPLSTGWSDNFEYAILDTDGSYMNTIEKQIS